MLSRAFFASILSTLLYTAAALGQLASFPKPAYFRETFARPVTKVELQSPVRLDDYVVGGKLDNRRTRFFNQKKLDELRARQVAAVKYLDRVVEELFDLVPKNTYITITSDHGELFGEEGYFGHGPILHDKVLEVPFVEGQLR